MFKINFGLLGAGGFGREVMPFAKRSVSKSLKVPEDQINFFFIETWQQKRKEVNGYQLISLDEFANLDGDKYFNVAIGNGIDREKVAMAVIKYAMPISLFSDQTTSFDSNLIADGAIFCPYSMITSNVTIGKFFQCNLYAYVAHDCVLGDFVTFAPGVCCNGRVHIDDFAYIGTNAIIREGTLEKPLRIGKSAIVGMGAVITKDVPDGAIVIGNPARRLIKK